MILTMDNLVRRTGVTIKEILVDYIHDIWENRVVDTIVANYRYGMKA